MLEEKSPWSELGLLLGYVIDRPESPEVGCASDGVLMPTFTGDRL